MEFWSTKVNNYDEAQKEINKALNAGTDLGDIEDYLEEILELDRITLKEYIDLMEWSKQEIDSFLNSRR